MDINIISSTLSLTLVKKQVLLNMRKVLEKKLALQSNIKLS